MLPTFFADRCIVSRQQSSKTFIHFSRTLEVRREVVGEDQTRADVAERSSQKMDDRGKMQPSWITLAER